MVYKKKLIEVALPLDAISKGCHEEKNPFLKGHPRSIHLWWARRPLAAARAVIFAQMADDPSAHPDIFPTEKDQEKERQRLFRIIEDLVLWENTTNEEVLQRARDKIWQSWRYTCAENADHPRAKELFDRHKLPAFHDPFAGGGALPLEAQRLGLEAYASDLNPVAVLINKAMIEIPPKFAGKPPVNPEANSQSRHSGRSEAETRNPEIKLDSRLRGNDALFTRERKGAQGLAEDVRYYGKWMRDEAEKRIGHLYPKVKVTPEIAKDRKDLLHYVGRELNVIAWLWARTVKSPNPAYAHVDVPLVSTFILSAKQGKEAYIEPVVQGASYRFLVRMGKPKDVQAATNGTKLARGANFQCIVSGAPISAEHIKAEGLAGRMGARLLAVVGEGDRGRVFLPPSIQQENVVHLAEAGWKPDLKMPIDRRWFSPPIYGMPTYGDLFTSRQLIALTTFSDLAQEARARVLEDLQSLEAVPSSGSKDWKAAYADAVATYLACGVSQMSRYACMLCAWNKSNENIAQAFGRQAIPMVWDYAESNPLVGSLAIDVCIGWVASAIQRAGSSGNSLQVDAQTQTISKDKLISTDPPYYDNIGYADLSDFFYVWLRRSLKPIYPELFSTVAVPKAEELVATPYRHGSKVKAEAFFMDGMTQAMHRLEEQAHPAFPVTIYYAFKQSETKSNAGTASTGWETFLDAVIRAGFAITGTWPLRTERTVGLKGNVNVLASSIILVCRKRAADSPTATRREFVTSLKSELPVALDHLQRCNIAPVDLAQAAIGPGMAVYTRYSKVLDAEGKTLSVREALALINQTLDEALAEQEGDFDADSRWAVAWFEQSGFAEGDFGVADVLARAKNTSVSGMVEAGILASSHGKVRLLRPDELPADWDPSKDKRLTAWEMVHQLIRALESGGDRAAAELVTRLGSKAEIARELAYRLYMLCDRKKRAAEALSYNGLVQSWPEISRLARDNSKSPKTQGPLFEMNEE
jgi:putative DNA methylase